MLQLPAAERWAVKHFDDRNRAVDSTNQQAVHAQTKTSLDQSLTLRPRQSRDPVWLDIQVTAMTAFILHHTKTDTLLPLPQVIHTKRSRVGQPFYESVCLSVIPHDILKNDEARITNLTHRNVPPRVLENYLFVGSKDQRPRSRSTEKHCRHGSLHSCWVMASFSVRLTINRSRVWLQGRVRLHNELWASCPRPNVKVVANGQCDVLQMGR